jgi:DNA-binding transcriptional regulator YiaG
MTHDERMARLTPITKADLLRRLPEPDERRTIRLAAKLTLRDIATEVGATPQAVALWEQGTTPSPAYLPAYVKLLDSLGVYADAGAAS